MRFSAQQTQEDLYFTNDLQRFIDKMSKMLPHMLLCVTIWAIIGQSLCFWTKTQEQDQTCTNSLQAMLSEPTLDKSNSTPEALPQWNHVAEFLNIGRRHPSLFVGVPLVGTLLLVIWQLHVDPMSFMRCARTIVFIVFLISIPWNWWHLYQVEKARRMPVLLAQMPKSCRLDQLGRMERAWEALKSSFRFGPTDCEEWHEKMWVDPIWEVPPTKAVAVTFTKFLFEPINHLGKSFNQIIKGAMDDMPYFWTLPTYIFLMLFISVVLIAIIALIVMSCMMSFGYKVNFGLFGISPGADKSVSKLKKLQANIKELQERIKELETQNRQLMLTNHKLVSTLAPKELENITKIDQQNTQPPGETGIDQTKLDFINNPKCLKNS